MPAPPVKRSVSDPLDVDLTWFIECLTLPPTATATATTDPEPVKKEAEAEAVTAKAVTLKHLCPEKHELTTMTIKADTELQYTCDLCDKVQVGWLLLLFFFNILFLLSCRCCYGLSVLMCFVTNTDVVITSQPLSNPQSLRSLTRLDIDVLPHSCPSSLTHSQSPVCLV